MLRKILLFQWLTLCILTIPAGAVSLRISQIDTQKLLINQEVNLYLSVTDDQGTPLENLSSTFFQLEESGGGKNYQAIPQFEAFRQGTNYEEGVNFLLLIDNSGSMYRTMAGEKTNQDGRRRISLAKAAVRSFLKSMTNPKDKVGLGIYNKLYHSFSRLDSDKEKVSQFVQQINREIGDANYTEIYGSLQLAVDEFRSTRGRKAIIILSDGENRPSYPHSKQEHPVFGKEVISYQTPLKSLQLEGISLYVINFGKKGEKKDRDLSRIAKETGGTTFDAYNQKQLGQVYLKIMDQILKEYVLTYRATMEPTDQKFIRVVFEGQGQKAETTRLYFSSTVFGTPPKELDPWILLALILPMGLLYWLSKIKFEKKTEFPALEVIGQGSGQVTTKIVNLDQAQTIIGSAPDAHLTIAGVPSIEEQHATIMFEENKNQYTLIGTGHLMVNNKAVTTKILEPGDLINVDGVTMVFDR